MKTYGLVGKTLDHSFSKKFFDNYFQKNSINAQFTNFELENISLIKEVFEQTISGLTVTIPYKEAIIPFLDDLTPEAKKIGAVNVVQFIDGKRIGHNSDAFGFQQSIKPFLTNKHERALILGTGGASKAVEFVFKNIGIDVLFCSRNPKAKNEFPYSALNDNMIKACKVIVNCTPIGTYPNVKDSINIPFEFLTTEHLVVDLIYNPSKTKFLHNSENYGATILNGESMLKEQALQAYKIWTT